MAETLSHEQELLESSRWRRFFAPFDAFTEPIIDPSSQSTPTHVAFFFVYMAVALAYIIFLIASFATRAPTESFSLVHASTVPPLSLQLSLECGSPWVCHSGFGGEPGNWTWNGTVEVNDIYGGEGAATGGCTTALVNIPGRDNADMRYTANRSVCYSRDGSHGLEVVVPSFSGACAYGDPGCGVFLRVELRAPAADGGEGMTLTVDVEPSQRKAVYIGQVIRRTQLGNGRWNVGGWLDASELGESEVVEPYVADLFYEGKNRGSAAHLRIRVRQFAEQFVTSFQGSVWSLLGEIGGANAMLLGTLALCVGVVQSLPAPATAKGRAASRAKLAYGSACIASSATSRTSTNDAGTVPLSQFASGSPRPAPGEADRA
jgi:hypothetical protein